MILTLILSKMGEDEKAIQAYNRAIEIDYHDAKAWINKSKALNKLGRSEESIKAIDKAIEIDPQLKE